MNKREANGRWGSKWLKGCWLILVFLLAACHYSTPDYSSWNLTEEQRDSLEFRATHHYGVNYNFKVLADSLPLRQMLNPDSLWVYKGNILVVADIARMESDTTDSIWIKVARDQSTMGWIAENRLLKHVVPLDPISQFIHWFSSLRTVLFTLVIAAFILLYLYRRTKRTSFRLVREERVDRIYPVLFCLCVVAAATLYSIMQRFAPDTWVQYYYYPSLNPFGHPFVLGLFIAFVWAMLLALLAMVDDLFHQMDFVSGFFYLLGVGTISLFLYILVTFTVYYYVGFLLVAAIFVLAWQYLSSIYSETYVCGHCGKRLQHKGICPHCGYYNE